VAGIGRSQYGIANDVRARLSGGAGRPTGAPVVLSECAVAAPAAAPGLAKNVILFKPGAVLLFSLPFASACAIDLHHKCNEGQAELTL
jgi:hypothetical protein